MTYQEAETLVSEHHRHFHLNSDLTIANKTAKYLGLIICPDNSDRDLKQLIYDETIKNGVNNKFVLEQLNLNNDLNVFLIYQQNGQEVVIPLESYLQSRSKTS